jgi:hypothetical protein
MKAYSSSLELYVASGGSGIDVREEGSGDWEGSRDGESSVCIGVSIIASIITMNLRRAVY